MKGRTQTKQKQKFIGILRPEERHKGMAQSRGRLVWGRLRAGIPMVYLAQINSLLSLAPAAPAWSLQDTFRKW